MSGRKTLKQRICMRGMTSTPLNADKGPMPLPFPKNISIVKKTSKGIENSTFESPMSTFDIGKKGSRSNDKHSRNFKSPKKCSSKRRCDTPLKFKRSPLLLKNLTMCTQKLEFSHFASNISDSNQPQEQYAENNTSRAVLGKAFGKSRRGETGKTQKLLRNWDCISVTSNQSSNSYNKCSSDAMNNSDSIETCRRNSSGSSTVDCSFDIDILSDEVAESSIVVTEDSEFITADKISASEDGSEGSSERSIKSVDSGELLSKQFSTLACWEIDRDNGTDSKTRTNYNESRAVPVDVPKSEDPILETETIICDKQINALDSLNNIAETVRHKRNTKVKANLTSNDKAGVSYQANIKTLKKGKAINSTKPPDKDYVEVQTPSAKNVNFADSLASSEGFAFTKLFSQPVNNLKESVTRKITLKNKRSKYDNTETLKTTSSYPSTSTPFDSPEIAFQNIPSAFKDLSPVNRSNKNEAKGCPEDDILVCTVKAGRTYAKDPQMKLTHVKETQRWKCFLETDSYDNCKRKNKNNCIYESRVSKNKSNCFLYESPPLHLNEGIPVDDISKLRNKVLKNTPEPTLKNKNGKLSKKKNRV